MYDWLNMPLVILDFLFKVVFFPLELVNGPGGTWAVVAILLVLALL